MKSVEVSDRGGFSIGRIIIRSGTGARIAIPVCSEYMGAFEGKRILAAFPDLISIFDRETALPLGSEQVRRSRRVALYFVPREHLPLAPARRDGSILRHVERLIGVRLLRQLLTETDPGVSANAL